MTKPGPSVTSGADTQPGSDSLFPTGFGGGGANVRPGGVGTSEIADGSVAAADLNLPSVAAAIAVRSELTGTYAAVPKNTVALLGDSITYRGSFTQIFATRLQRLQAAKGAWTWAEMALGSRMTQIFSSVDMVAFGQVGYDAQALIDGGYVAAVIAAAPGWCVLECGSNDIYGLGSTGAQASAAILKVTRLLTAAGIRVVVCTIPPRAMTGTETAGQATEMRVANRLIRQWAPTEKNVVLCDWFGALIDPATGNGNTAYYIDGVHPNTAGAARMGKVLGDVLSPLVPALPDLPGDVAGILGTTALMTGTSGTTAGAGTATGSFATGVICNVDSGVTLVGSKVARSDPFPGEWQQVAVSAGSATTGYNLTVKSNGLSGFALGDTVYAVVEFETDAASWAGRQLSANLYCYPGNSFNLVPNGEVGYCASADLSALTTNIYQGAVVKGIMRTPSVVVASDTTRIQMELKFKGAAGTVRWGRTQIHKVG